MSAVRLTILGAGSVQCGPAVVGSLATYFGERPLQIRMYDADEERLDTFDRLARICFISTYASHELMSTTDPREAMEDTDAIVLALDANCARRYLRANRSGGVAEIGDLGMVEQAVMGLLGGVPSSVPVLSLLDSSIEVPRSTYHRVEWPGPISEERRITLPMQIIRWLNKEDMLYELLSAYEESPLKAWLDNPQSAELVLGTPA